MIKVERWLNHDIRFVSNGNEWQAIAKDIADALEYSDANKRLYEKSRKMKGIRTMKKTDMYDIAEKLTNFTNQLDNVTELMLININNSDISEGNELDHLYFLVDYAKQISHDLYNFSNEIIKDDAKR